MTKTTHETTLKPRMKPRINFLILKGNHANHACFPRTYIGENVGNVEMRRVHVSRAYTYRSVVSVVSVISMTYVIFMRGFSVVFDFHAWFFEKAGGEAWES